jgi:diguanylate cyclase (GGDEF)-like protein
VATIERPDRAARPRRGSGRPGARDPLTGLANRTALWQYLDRALADDGRLAVLFIDLDDFKDVNDSLGHSAGDELLIEMADRLRRCARSSDVVVRFGGDEFVLLLRDVPDRACRSNGWLTGSSPPIREPLELAGQDTVVTASIGIVWPDDAVEGAMSMSRGFCATPTSHSFTPSDPARTVLPDSTRRCATALSVASASPGRCAEHRQDSDELTVHFQPIVDLAEGRIVGLEALARWTSSELGVVPPVDFVPVAEETGLITALACRILDRALAPMGEWRALPGCSELFVAVNMSARDLTEPT